MKLVEDRGKYRRKQAWGREGEEEMRKGRKFFYLVIASVIDVSHMLLLHCLHYCHVFVQSQHCGNNIRRYQDILSSLVFQSVYKFQYKCLLHIWEHMEPSRKFLQRCKFRRDGVQTTFWSVMDGRTPTFLMLCSAIVTIHNYPSLHMK